jgi:predicted Fe-Mo cluster-binding NifX family protein
MIRYEPKESPYRCIGLPLEDKTGRINMHFGEAPYFGIVCVGKKDGEIKQQDIIENPFRLEKTAKGIRVAEWLVEQKVEDVGMKEDLSYKGPGYVLSNAHVKTHVISADHLHQASAK